MRVDPKDGVCRSCRGPLDIVDFDDVSMTVVCDNPTCGDEYDVETDAFGDGCVTYYFQLVAERMLGGDHEE